MRPNPGPSSLLFMAQPAMEVRLAMQQVAAASGWDRQLGSALFDPVNWHQSFSYKVPYSNEVRDRMIRAGAQVDAVAFTMVLNRVRGSGGRGDSSSIHWEFRATKRPSGFDALQAALRNALLEEDFGEMGGNTPHVTISYWAPCALPSTTIPPIPWQIDELLLVETRAGTPRYHAIARWPLRPAPVELVSQGELW